MLVIIFVFVAVVAYLIFHFIVPFGDSSVLFTRDFSLKAQFKRAKKSSPWIKMLLGEDFVFPAEVIDKTENGEPVLSHNEPKGGEVTLSEAFACLAEYDSVAANVDIKSTKALEKVLPLAEEYGVEERIFFTGVSEDYLADVKSKAQGINYYLNLEVDASLAADSGYLDTLVAKTKNAGAEGINMNYKGLTAELVKAFHENGLKVSVWTVDGELDMYKALSASPDNITTRSPSKLCEITEESR